MVLYTEGVNMNIYVGNLSYDLTDEELDARRAEWVMPPYKATRGTLYKFIKNVKDASHGCVTDE